MLLSLALSSTNGTQLPWRCQSQTHLHSPVQYSYTGTATDRPVMEWLNTYAFPRETAHSDSVAATKEYMKLCNRLVADGTTTVLVFGTIYKEACQRLALCLQAQGLRGFVGKVCMDRWLLLVPQFTGTRLSATWHPDLQ